MLKVSQWFGHAGRYLRNMTKSHAAMRYIVWYAAMLVIGCTIYVSAWLYDWYTAVRPDLVEFRNFLHEISGAAWIAAIGFLAKAFIDQNNNGIPDQYEEKEDKDNGKSKPEGPASDV